MSYPCAANQIGYRLVTRMMIETNVSIMNWLKDTSARLYGKSETPLNDARVLLSDHLKVTSSWLASHPDTILSQSTLSELEEKTIQMASGFPLPYLLKSWEFYGLSFLVTPEVLIPRPETELLVEKALSWLHGHPEVDTGYDIGTGTGCIAIALAHHYSNLNLIATDKSAAALKVAQENVLRHQLTDRIQLYQSDMLATVPQTEIHLLCANLPYIPSGDLAALPVAIYEPVLALDGGPDGLDRYRELLTQAKPYLAEPFCVILEMEYRQADALGSIVKRILPDAVPNVVHDLSGLPRLMMVEGGDAHARH